MLSNQMFHPVIHSYIRSNKHMLHVASLLIIVEVASRVLGIHLIPLWVNASVFTKVKFPDEITLHEGGTMADFI